MRIAVVAQNVVRQDGQGRFALEVARELAERGHDVTVLAHRLAEELQGAVRFRCVVARRGPQLIDDVRFLLFASWFVRRHGYDAVFSVGPTVATSGAHVADAQFSHRGWRAAWGLSLRPAFAHRLHTHIAGELERMTMSRAHVLIAPTAQLADDVDPGRPLSATVLLPNGVDLDEFADIGPDERAAARTTFGIPDDAFALCFLGEYVTPRKGLDPLLEAVAGGPPGEHLVIAGRGPDLGDRLNALGIADRVHVVGFAHPRDVVAAADAAVVPSWYEPFSLVALEAAAAGLPVVITAIAGASGYLGAGAVIVDRPDPVQLRAAFDRLTSDRPAAASIAAAGRVAAGALRWEVVAAEAADVVERTARPAPARPDRPRIAYLTDTMADLRMIEGLAERAEITLVAPRSLGDKITNFWPPRRGTTVERIEIDGGRLAFIPRAARWLRRHRGRFDAVVVLDNLGAALGANLGRLAGGPPVVIQVGRPTLDYLRCQPTTPRTVARRFVAWGLVEINERLADGIGAVSDYCAAQCSRRNANVVSVPWYGVDIDRFGAVVNRETARRRLDLPLDAPIVMLRSRLAPEKDPDTFLRAIGRLRAAGRDVVGLYMGGELEELAQACDRTGVDVIARKPSSVDEIPLWYIAADIDVQSSRAEGLGVSPLEAMSCGTPVVVTDVGGLPEVVDHGRVGLLVEPGDDLALAEAVGRLLDDPEWARELGAKGRQLVVERFASEHAFAKWAALIDRSRA